MYFDAAKKEQEVSRLIKKLQQFIAEFESQQPIKNNLSYFDRCFEVKETPKEGENYCQKMKNSYRSSTDRADIEFCTPIFFKNPAGASHAYRQRNDIELLFDDMKNIIDCNRLRVHIEQVMKGRLFIDFVTLIILTAPKKRIKLIPAKQRKYWNHLLSSWIK